MPEPLVVWALSRHVAFAGAVVVGVFSTAERARDRAAVLAAEERPRASSWPQVDWWSLRGHEVDAEGPPVEAWNGDPRPLVVGSPIGTEIVWRKMTREEVIGSA